jgi:hypothetical protein
METEMDLTLEDLASEEAWARDYKWETDGAFSDMLILPRKTYLNVIAAARAHLERQELVYCVGCGRKASKDPQPPQQREDERPEDEPIDRAQAEIERLRRLLKGCWQTDTLPLAVEMEIEEALTKNYLKP